MREITIYKDYPWDECGTAYTDGIVLREDHSFFAEIYNHWEDGRFVLSSDCSTEGDTVYKYCFDKLYEYFANEENISDLDEWDENVFLASSFETTDKENLVKESDILDYAEEKSYDVFNVMTDECANLRLCLAYIICDANLSMWLGDDCCCAEKEELAEKIKSMMETDK